VQPDGAFELRDIRPGNYTLFLNPIYGFQPHNILVGSQDVSGLLISFQAPASQATFNRPSPNVPSIVASSFSADQKIVNGRVVFDGTYSNVIPPPVTLQLTQPNGQTISGPVANGVFKLGLGRGDYRITFLDLPPGSRVKSIIYGQLSMMVDLQKMPLNTDRIHPSVDVMVTLSSPSNTAQGSRGATISGQVTGWREQIPNPRRLLVVGPGPSDLRQVAIASNGKFSLPGVQPGKYTFRVSGLRFSSVEAKTIDVSDKNIGNVDIHVPIVISLPGEITVDGGPLPATTGMSVQAGAESAAVRPDGSFAITLTDEKRQFFVMGLPPGYYVKSMVLKKRVVSAINLPPLNSQPARTVTTDVTNKTVGVSRTNIGDSFRLSITLGVR
jgi:hypothetical protein